MTEKISRVDRYETAIKEAIARLYKETLHLGAAVDPDVDRLSLAVLDARIILGKALADG